MKVIEQALEQFFRVPPQPDPPAGAADSLRVFRASNGYLRYSLLRWALGQSWAVAIVVLYLWFEYQYGILNFAVEHFGRFGMILNSTPDYVWPLVTIAETVALAFLLLRLPITFFMTLLDFRLRWYMTTDRSLRIREGLSHIREQTMMFSNIQNVAIRQGPLQRYFGISDVEVRSAGGGESPKKGQPQSDESDDMHVCYFRGVSNAAEIRDLILTHLRRIRGAGLGDPEDHAADAPHDDPALAAGRLLLNEAQALRRVLSTD